MKIRKLRTVLIGTGILLLVWKTSLRAASYNVMFNNVEQGPNSTANPTLSVSPSMLQPQANALANAPSTTPAPVMPADTSSSSGATVQASNAQAVQVDESASKHKFRLGLSGVLLSSNPTSGFIEQNAKNAGAAISASYFPLRDLGLTGFTGVTEANSTHFYGGELEVVPLRLTLFGLSNFIEAGALAGASNIGSSPTLWGTVHAGAHAAVNFGERYSISGRVRTNLSGREEYKGWLGEVGLFVRL